LFLFDLTAARDQSHPCINLDLFLRNLTLIKIKVKK
jgi:hypothetical protein